MPALTGRMMRAVAWRLRRHIASPTPVAAPPLKLAVAEAREVLVVALAEPGDMVLLSPFVRELRRLAPAARVTLVTLPACAILYESSEDVDEVIPYPARVSRLLRPLVLPRRARSFAINRLRRPFDVAIVPRWDTDHHLATAVAVYSDAPRRVGHSEHATPRKQVLNAGFDSLFTDVVSSTGVAHEVDRHLAMLRMLGAEPSTDALELALTAADRQRAANELSHVPSERILVTLGVGAAHPKRRWPVSRFAEVGRFLQGAFGAHIVVVGGPDDVESQRELLRALGSGATGLAGRLTLRESGAVLERSTLFIGNDSAPLQLAAAAGVPCVEISCHPAHGDPLHHNAPERFGPWRVPSAVVRPPAAVPPCTRCCSAKHPHCILEVSSDMVTRAAAALLRTAHGSIAENPMRHGPPSHHAARIAARGSDE